MDDTGRVSRTVGAGIGLGALLTLPALFLAAASGGAGHGDYGLARALFPAPMLLTLLEGSIGAPSLGLAFLQFPAYGGLLGWAMARKNYLPAVVVASAHLIAVIICFPGALPNFS
jgi:hypothetical protein